MKKVLVITGSTASGKSQLAIKIAHQFNGEIISCDSVQVYKGMDIGSAKISREEMDGIPHHLIDILELDEPMNVALFQAKARQLVDEITKRGKLPICVGGTGFYIKALLYDYRFEVEDETITDDYDLMTNESLHEKLLIKDRKQAAKIHVNNRKRLLRVLRLMDRQQKTRTEIIEEQRDELLYDAKIFYLTFDRETLVERIHERVNQMIEQGLIEEVRALTKDGTDFECQALGAIGYREWEAYFKKERTLLETIEKIKTHTRQFSKRQMTWFKNQMPGSLIFVDENTPHDIASSVQKWLDFGTIIEEEGMN